MAPLLAIGHNGAVTSGSTGKRAGSRRAAPARTGGGRRLALYAVGVTLTLVAWGYLVSAAIDFGASARNGESIAWVFLVLAALGAVGCLFASLMLAARVLRTLGITREPDAAPTPPRVPGGRRAAR